CYRGGEVCLVSAKKSSLLERLPQPLVDRDEVQRDDRASLLHETRESLGVGNACLRVAISVPECHAPGGRRIVAPGREAGLERSDPASDLPEPKPRAEQAPQL